MTDESFRALACRPFDGVWKAYKSPDGFVSIHQHDAATLLRSGLPLSQWEGQFLDAVHNQREPLTPAQEYWFSKLCDRLASDVRKVAA